MGLLKRLRENAQLLEDRGRGDDRIAARVHVRPGELEHLLHAALVTWLTQQLDGHVVVPLGVQRWNREVLAVVRERRLGPGFQEQLERLFKRGPVSLLVLDRRPVRTAKHLHFAWLTATAKPKFHAPPAHDVQHRCLFRDAQRMPPGEDVGVLPEADAARLCGDGHLHEHGIRTKLRALRLKVVLDRPQVVKAQLLGEHALFDLVQHATLVARVHVRQAARR